MIVISTAKALECICIDLVIWIQTEGFLLCFSERMISEAKYPAEVIRKR